MSGLPSFEPSERLRWIVVTGAIVFLLWRAWIVLLSALLPASATVDVLLDDAYYYLQIAYNLARLGRSSFDGITSSNGYQPAWMALLAAIQYVLRLDKHGLFVAAQALMWLTLACPIGYCLWRARDPFFLALAAGLTASCACFPGIYAAGLETALFAPAFVALAVVARHGLSAGASKAAWLFCLVVLIRLDALSLLLVYALALSWRTFRRAGFAAALEQGLRVSAPSLLVLILYGIGNQLAFGSPVPLSGVAKAIGAVPFSNWGILYNYAVQAIPLIGSALFVLPIELGFTRFEGGRFYYAGIGLLALSLLFHYGYYAAFSGWIPWPWYFYAYALMQALLVARAVELAARLNGRAPALLALGLLLLSTWAAPFATHVLLTRQLFENQARGGQPGGSFNRRNVADAQAYARTGPKLVVAIGDRAAGLGYWSPDRVQVFPLEGLVADKAYLRARLRDEGERWVAEIIRPRHLIVDRETLAPVRIGDEEQYVVIEPIQGRVVMDHLLVFCFPKEAVARVLHGRDDQQLVLPAPATRITFEFEKGGRCHGAFAEYAQRQILSPDSLRKRAVTVEYAPFLAGGLNEALERFDRRLALRVRDYLRTR